MEDIREIEIERVTLSDRFSSLTDEWKEKVLQHNKKLESLSVKREQHMLRIAELSKEVIPNEEEIMLNEKSVFLIDSEIRNLNIQIQTEYNNG